MKQSNDYSFMYEKLIKKTSRAFKQCKDLCDTYESATNRTLYELESVIDGDPIVDSRKDNNITNKEVELRMFKDIVVRVELCYLLAEDNLYNLSLQLYKESLIKYGLEDGLGFINKIDEIIKNEFVKNEIKRKINVITHITF